MQDAREDAPDFGATFLAMASDSTFCFPEEPRCDVETINGTEYCLCSDEPFVVVTDPQDPEYWEPNPPPAWPDPPGYPQAGDSPSGPGPGDPCEIGCPLEFEVALSCETGVVRGETGRCELTVEPEELLDHVYGWTFKGKGSGYDGLNAWSSQYHESHWEGPFVASGEVRVDFRVADEFEQSFDVVAVSEFQVVPRDGSEWDWTDDHWEFRPDEAPTAHGHEAQAWAEASKAENDILGLAEGAVRGTQIQLVWRLEDLLEDPADRIHDAGAIEPTGNWSGQVWAWDTSSSEYMLLQPWSF